MSTVSDVIIHDHKELKDCYNEIVNSTDHDHQARYGNQFVWEEGKSMAETDRKEHHKLKEYLEEFQNMEASHPDYVPKLKSLYTFVG
ncbi:HHE domain-containing protein [Paraphaeosphaeria sporulosa]